MAKSPLYDALVPAIPKPKDDYSAESLTPQMPPPATPELDQAKKKVKQ